MTQNETLKQEFHEKSPTFPRKTVVFEKPMINCSIVEHDPKLVTRSLLLKPIRVTKDGAAVVPLGDRVYPLRLDSRSEFCVLRNGASYEARVGLIPEIPFSTAVQFAEMPMELKFGENFSWKLERDEFGVFVYVSGSDLLVEQLVSHLVERNGLKIISWGDSSRPDYDWSIHFSAGLSIQTIQSAIGKVSENIEELFEAEQRRESKAQLDLSKKELENQKREVAAELGSKDAELKAVYEELTTALQRIDVLSAQLREHADDTAFSKEAATSLKRGKAHKALARMMFSCFSNLAFPPDTISLISERFAESDALWQLLASLNSGDGLPMEKLKGVAGKVGWLEVRQHINTGNDNRGRVYCRKSSKAHAFDVVVHWKKDKKDQEKMFAKLARYPSFTGSEGVLK